jgi:hypothetical protein
MRLLARWRLKPEMASNFTANEPDVVPRSGFDINATGIFTEQNPVRQFGLEALSPDVSPFKAAAELVTAAASGACAAGILVECLNFRAHEPREAAGVRMEESEAIEEVLAVVDGHKRPRIQRRVWLHRQERLTDEHRPPPHAVGQTGVP